MKFHSPYQFIAIKAASKESKTDYKNRDALKNNNYTRHDRWHEKGLSGSIHCTLTTKSPLVVGADQTKGTESAPGCVTQYKHPNGTIAIPANSLRGMIANIAETLSQSSLRVLGTEWCEKFEKNGSFYSAVKRASDKDALPWSKNRNELTPAECLFGVVEEDFDEKEGARNLASRLQLTDATPVNEIKLEECITLKILDSPEPPSPAMYFHSNSGNQHIVKKNLNFNQHNPNGRKHYLPQPKAIEKNSWETKIPKDQEGKSWTQHLNCKPIPTGEKFKFIIHFENLSQPELGLLQTAISPCNDEKAFIHRLGLGKPLGLGQIVLKIDKIKKINRVKRYSLEGLNQQSDDQTWKETNLDESLIDIETHKALTTLYNPKNIKLDVCYPFNGNEGQEPYNEDEGFSWFVENKKRGGIEKLVPIEANKDIPKLDSFTPKK